VATRRTTVLIVAAVLGCLLLPSGALLLVSGVRTGHDGRTVSGILLGIAGLACLRVLMWARRIRLMTRAGLALRGDRDEGADDGGDDGGDDEGDDEDDDGGAGNGERAAHP
jgi:hypothetical protein